MANTFYNKLSANVGTSLTSVGSYTVGSGNTAIVLGLTVCNTSGATINIDVTINNGSTDFYIVKNAPISAGGSLVPIGGDQKIVLQATHSLKVKSDAATSADAILSIMEIS